MLAALEFIKLFGVTKKVLLEYAIKWQDEHASWGYKLNMEYYKFIVNLVYKLKHTSPDEITVWFPNQPDKDKRYAEWLATKDVRDVKNAEARDKANARREAKALVRTEITEHNMLVGDLSAERKFTDYNAAYGFYYGYTRRINIVKLTTDGTQIQTTGGAYIPVDRAKYIWALLTESYEFYKRSHSIINEFSDSVKRLFKPYDIRDIDFKKGLLHVGCHYISILSIRRLAKQLGFKDIWGQF